MAERKKTRDIAFIALAAAMMAVSAQISIPLTIPVTLQTLAVFLAVTLLGTYRGCVAIAIYIVMGIIGLPVFANFKGGFSAVLGPTGGYIIGFIPMAITAGLLIGSSRSRVRIIAALSAGLIVLYAFGTVFYMIVWARRGGEIGALAVLSNCVFPFIPADAIKILACAEITAQLKSRIKI